MAIRFFQPGDQVGIQQLYTKVFGKQRSSLVWEWKYVSHPNPVNPWILVFERNNRIAGHIALWVSEVFINGKTQLAGLRVDTMVDPDDRGEGIYQQLNEAMFTEARKSGIKLLYGFPAPKARELLLTRTQAKEAGRVSRFVYIQNPIALAAGMIRIASPAKPLSSLYKKVFNKQKKKSSTKYQLESVTACDESFTNLTDRLSTIRPVVIRRSHGYLNWRYHQHPEYTYHMLALRQGADLAGYVVVKEEVKQLKHGSLAVGTIVDWLAIDDEKVWQELLQGALHQLRDCDVVQSWALPETPSANVLASNGFKVKDHPLALVVHPLENATIGSRLEDWYLHQGDVDSF
ncbi:GNAT family N-acetyltransferase [Sediminibacillus halophilus]|uniref:Acetyltransferase (GNAT) domain-containing protein n=1 Tax=Sediminibacillus halophilus TaxID=482461 RepID=A0A1G9U4E9_9BACI|nr:GNAT family N-acetyltransferase [Sediminibacillus halophilus]SDM54806.1 Acetyltransferase (GNAT) domain-containing protein [Sediminibacillus halophilus]